MIKSYLNFHQISQNENKGLQCKNWGQVFAQNTKQICILYFFFNVSDPKKGIIYFLFCLIKPLNKNWSSSHTSLLTFTYKIIINKRNITHRGYKLADNVGWNSRCADYIRSGSRCPDVVRVRLRRIQLGYLENICHNNLNIFILFIMRWLSYSLCHFVSERRLYKFMPTLQKF